MKDGKIKGRYELFPYPMAEAELGALMLLNPV
jgi:hypothetical protein